MKKDQGGKAAQLLLAKRLPARRIGPCSQMRLFDQFKEDRGNIR
nr:hypothetical protein [Rhodovulum steppense]